MWHVCMKEKYNPMSIHPEPHKNGTKLTTQRRTKMLPTIIQFLFVFMHFKYSQWQHVARSWCLLTSAVRDTSSNTIFTLLTERY